MQNDSMPNTREKISYMESELDFFTDSTDEISQTVLAESQLSITAEDPADTCNAEIGHIWKRISKWISEGDKEAAYYAEELKAEGKRANSFATTRKPQGTVKDVPQQSEK